MFTGIVEIVGRVVSLERAATARLTVDLSGIAEGVRPGDSVAVDGVCLTVTHIDGTRGSFDVGEETLRRSTLGALRPGDRVNLERALRVGDRLGGHFVLGHVDAVGTIARLDRRDDQATLVVRAGADLVARLVPKGSVAVDGISLTVGRIGPEEFTLFIIPHTLRNTGLAGKAVGDLVNIELDIIGKYVERLLDARSRGPAGMTEEFLRQHGFA